MDLLASAYGWSKHDIYYDTYPDELARLSRRIQARQIEDYRVRLAIAQNPYAKNPKELWERLRPPRIYPKIEPKLDERAFDALKQKLAGTGKFVVK